MRAQRSSARRSTRWTALSSTRSGIAFSRATRRRSWSSAWRTLQRCGRRSPQQGFGLLEDLGRQIRRIAHRLDGVVESVARRLTGKEQRTEKTDNAGLVTRALALAVDVGLVNLSFFALSALFDWALSAVAQWDSSANYAIAVGISFYVILIASYLAFFWTLTGQTPGMRFLGIRLDDYDGTPCVSPRTAFRRLIGMALAVLTLGLGFLVVLFSDRRRGLHDRVARTEVILVDRQGNPESAELRTEARQDEAARRR